MQFIVNDKVKMVTPDGEIEGQIIECTTQARRERDGQVATIHYVKLAVREPKRELRAPLVEIATKGVR